MERRKLLNNRNGYTAILVVISIGTAALLVALSAVSVGLDELDNSVQYGRGQEARIVAEGCAEETLRRFQLNPEYSAFEKYLELGGGSCSISTSATGTERTISVFASRDNYYKKIFIETLINEGEVIINSWEEVYN